MPENWDQFELVAPDWADFELVDSEREARKAELAQQKTQLQREAVVSETMGKAFGAAERALEPLTPSGLMNQPFRASRAVGATDMPDPYAPGRPLVTLPKPPGTDVLSGVGQLAAGVVEGLTTPEMLVTLPAAPASPVVRALFAGEMAKSLPEGIAVAGETIRNPEATPAEKVVATGQPLVSAAFVRGLARTPEAFTPVERPPTPPVPGDTLKMPEGAKPPPPKAETPAAPESAKQVEAAKPGPRFGVVKQGDMWAITRDGEPMEGAFHDKEMADFTADGLNRGVAEKQQREAAAEAMYENEGEGVGGVSYIPLSQAQVREIPAHIEKEVPNATEARSEQGGVPPERPRDDTGGAPKETGASSSVPPAAGVPQKAPEVLLAPKPKRGRKSKAQPATPPAETKAPWQMTLAEWREAWGKGQREAAPSQPESWYKAQEERAHRNAIERALREGKPVPPEVLKDYPELQGKKVEPAASTSKFEMTFEQFLNAPREGALLEELRKLPKREKSEQELAATERIDKAYEALEKAGLGWVLNQSTQSRIALRKLPKAKQKIVNEYNEAWKERSRVHNEETTSIQRKLYDALVERGVIKSPEAKPAAEPVGMGGAVPSEFGPQAQVTTAAKNAAIDRDRVERGQPPMMAALRKSDAELWAQAMNAIDADWQVADKLIASLKANPRVLLDWEHMVLLHRRVDLKNEWYKATREIEQATAESRIEAADAAGAHRSKISEALLELDEVVGRGDTAAGTLAGRALRARRLAMNEDFSLAELVAERSDALGRKLTDAEIAETKRVADEWKAKSDALEKRIAELEPEKTLRQEAEILAKTQRDARADGISDKMLEIAREIVGRWDREAEDASKRLMAKFARTSAGIDPTILLDLAKIGRAYLGHKALDFAEFSAKLTEKFGEAVSPYLKPAWEKAQELIGTELKPKSEDVKRAVKLKQTDVNALGQRIAEKFAGKKDFSWQLQQLARYFVMQGERTAAGLLDKVYGVVQKFAPELSKSEVRDMLSGYGRFTQISKEATTVVLRDLKGQLQQIGKLEDMAKGQAPRKSGYERRTPSDEERRLIKQVEAKKKEGGYKVTDPETQLRTALQAAKRRLENQISDLEFQVTRREKIVKEKRTLKPDAELENLRARRDALKEQYAEVFPERPMTEAERLQQWKERTQEKIAEYRDKIARGDFKPKPKADPVRLDPEAIKIRFELHKVHRAIMDMRLKDKLAQRTALKKVADSAVNVVMVSRALMTGGEFSAVLRQGGIGAMSHPIRTAKATTQMFRAFASKEAQFRITEEIQTRQNAPLYQKAHLEFTELGTRLSTLEEHYMFRVNEKLRKLPGFKQVFGSLEAFQRAFTTFLNVVRADTFDAMVKEYGVGAAEAAANYVNVTTGRGSHSLGRFVGPGANALAFAPRLAISRWQYLFGQPIVNAKGYRGMILKEYARTLAGLSVVYGLGLLAGGEVEKDARSSDFGKIRFGKMRVDPLFGLAPVIRLISQQLTGTRKNTRSGIRPTRDKWRMPFAEDDITGERKVKYGEPTGGTLVGTYARTKLAPVPASAVNVMAGKDVTGQEITLSDEAIKLLTPITYGDIYQAFKEEGIDHGVAATILSVFGMGVQTYDNRR